jgi:hypothetical protein
MWRSRLAAYPPITRASSSARSQASNSQNHARPDLMNKPIIAGLLTAPVWAGTGTPREPEGRNLPRAPRSYSTMDASRLGNQFSAWCVAVPAIGTPTTVSVVRGAPGRGGLWGSSLLFVKPVQRVARCGPCHRLIPLPCRWSGSPDQRRCFLRPGSRYPPGISWPAGPLGPP